MGLEIATYISGLTASWPTSGEPKSQGDDHLRLLKGVLQSTFPNATGPMYLPSATSQLTGTVLLSAQNQTIFYDTSGGNFAITLPAGAPGGWACDILKYSLDQNAITVSPPSGNIFTAVGQVATVRVGACGSISRFISSGSAWFCSKHGPIVGTTLNWDGAAVPAGHLVLDGTAFNATTFAELNLALGGATLRDKRGRVEAGVDTATNRLGTAMPGQLANGGVGGLDYHYLTVNQIPLHHHGGTTDGDFPDHTHGQAGSYLVGTTQGQLAGGTFDPTIVRGATGLPAVGGASVRHTHTFNSSTNPSGLGSNWHPNVQPTIVVQKLIRAC